MNDDLISREALKAVINEYIDEYSDLDNQGYHCEKWCAMKEAEMAIDNAPTVLHDNYSMGYQDGVNKVLSERPQGEWINLDGGDRACPFCNMGMSGESNASLVFFNYCPFCGADMRKEAENEH